MRLTSIRHIITVLTHKYWVHKYARKFKIGKYTLLHDLSKFSPVEFNESIHYYSGIKSPIDNCKQIQGYSNAWLHHKGHNKHHWEYWVDFVDCKPVAINMPTRYKLEMLCDFFAAATVYSKSTCTFSMEYAWWQNKRNSVIMHPETLSFIDNILEFTSECFGDISISQADNNIWKIIYNKALEYLKH